MHATQYIYHKDDDWNEKQMAKKREVERASRRRERREREEHEMAMRRVKAQAVAGGAGAARTSSLKHSGEMSASGRTPKQRIRASSRATKDDDAAAAYLDDDDDDEESDLSMYKNADEVEDDLAFLEDAGNWLESGEGTQSAGTEDEGSMSQSLTSMDSGGDSLSA